MVGGGFYLGNVEVKPSDSPVNRPSLDILYIIEVTRRIHKKLM